MSSLPSCYPGIYLQSFNYADLKVLALLFDFLKRQIQYKIG